METTERKYLFSRLFLFFKEKEKILNYVFCLIKTFYAHKVNLWCLLKQRLTLRLQNSIETTINYRVVQIKTLISGTTIIWSMYLSLIYLLFFLVNSNQSSKKTIFLYFQLNLIFNFSKILSNMLFYKLGCSSNGQRCSITSRRDSSWSMYTYFLCFCKYRRFDIEC